MAKHSPELVPGSRWAYRASKGKELQEVRILKLGVKHPNRAFITFLDPLEEGEEAWVPIGRLKCRWEDVANYQAIEAKWGAIAAASAHASDVDAEVVELVFGCFDKTNSLNYWASNKAGVTAVSDPAIFQKIHSIQWENFVGDLSFEDDGQLIIPLDATIELARRLVVSDPDEILRHLDSEMRGAGREQLEDVARGKVGYKRWTLNGSSTRPRVEDLSDAAATIWGWLASSDVQRWNEIKVLQAEVARLSSIVARAADALEAKGHTRDAAGIRRLYGLTNYPVPHLKSYYEMTKDMKDAMQAGDDPALRDVLDRRVWANSPETGPIASSPPQDGQDMSPIIKGFRRRF